MDAISIRERPAEVMIEPFPGIGRAICCAGRATATCVATLVEPPFALLPPLVKVPGQRYGHSGRRPEPARAPASGDAAALVNLGSRPGDGPAQELYDGNGCTGVLLRSAKSLAARLERKHQRAIAAIPAEERRPVYVFAIRTRRNRSASQYPTTTNLGISNSGG